MNPLRPKGKSGKKKTRGQLRAEARAAQEAQAAAAAAALAQLTASSEKVTENKSNVCKPLSNVSTEESKKPKKSKSKNPHQSSSSKPAQSANPISKRIASFIEKFEPTKKQDAAANIQPVKGFSDYLNISSPYGLFKPSKIPFCLKGLYPCSCEPECQKAITESSSKTAFTDKNHVRSNSNSPPTQKRFSASVSAVKKLFENKPISAPATPLPQSPTPGRTKVTEIMKQFVELTEPSTKHKTSEQPVNQGSTTTCADEDLSKAMNLLNISGADNKEALSREKGKEQSIWRPKTLIEIYEQGSFDKQEEIQSPSTSQTDVAEQSDKAIEICNRGSFHEKEEIPSQSTSQTDVPDSFEALLEIYNRIISKKQEEIPSSSTSHTDPDPDISNIKDEYEDWDDSYTKLNSDFIDFVDLAAFARGVGIDVPSSFPNDLPEFTMSPEEISKAIEGITSAYMLSLKLVDTPESHSVETQTSPTYTEESPAANTEESPAANTEESPAANTEESPAANTEESLAANTDKSLATYEKQGAIPKRLVKSQKEQLEEVKKQRKISKMPQEFPPPSSKLQNVSVPLEKVPEPKEVKKYSFPCPLVDHKKTSPVEKPQILEPRTPVIRGYQILMRAQAERVRRRKLKKVSKLGDSSATKSSPDITQRKPGQPYKKTRSAIELFGTTSEDSYFLKSDKKSKKISKITYDFDEALLAPLEFKKDEAVETFVSPPMSDGEPAQGDIIPDDCKCKENVFQEGKFLPGLFSSPPPIPETILESIEGSQIRAEADYEGFDVPDNIFKADRSKRSPRRSRSRQRRRREKESRATPKTTKDKWHHDTTEPCCCEDINPFFAPMEEMFKLTSESLKDDIKVDRYIQSTLDSGQGGEADSPDLDFVYDDADTHANEIAELYSYTEQPEYQLNVRAFEEQMELFNLPPSWQRLTVEKRQSVVMKLLDQLESTRKPERMRSARCILYIAQGCWAEVQSDTEQQHWARLNTLMLFQLGTFDAFNDLLNIEIDNSTAAHVAMRKIAVSLADSQDLRVILSVMYTIVEVLRAEKLNESSEYTAEIDAFTYELGHATGEDHLVIKLLSMVTRFCSGAAPHFPMKKVLLLLWKVILISLGGMNKLKEMKAEKRRKAGLPPQDEDTMEIARTMRSSSPPASASDLLEAQNQKRSTRPFRRSLMKQSSLDDQESLSMEMETSMGSDNGDDIADMTEYDERRPTDTNEASQMFNNHILNMYNMQDSPPPQHEAMARGLPWKPKVRQKDIDAFLDTSRMKFLGYTLPGDQTTLFGLPQPIHEGVRILNEHVYTSLAEQQVAKEEEIARNPVSATEPEIDYNPTEILYQAMLPNLPQYMIALLKILLAAAPTSKAKTDSINIMADVLPEEMPMTVLQSMKLGNDVSRHKEIIVKAVSSILLLLLKHFKLNHIYQFEFMSQHLVFANCIPLVLKFFNQNIMGYIGAKNAIPILDFPACVLGDQPELTAESLEIGDAGSYSWRNMMSCINLLRILNKLTKWKHSRIMMLVVFKSAPILKRTLKIRHSNSQLYVLKLLKMQTKYLGRQWRKSNMKTISAIYQKVRHRLNDDWAYGNDLDARPWDFQAEECALRASVDRFNNRRYTQARDSEFEPVNNNVTSLLGTEHDLSEGFRRHYALWLEQEVFGPPVEWEKLLLDPPAEGADKEPKSEPEDKPDGDHGE